MAKKDELDRARMRKFAWGAIPKDELEDRPEADQPSTAIVRKEPQPSTEDFAAARKKVREGADTVEEAIERVLQCTDVEEQRKLVRSLVPTLEEAGLWFFGRPEDDPLIPRTLRVLLQHRDIIGESVLESTLSILTLGPSTHPDFCDVLEELSRAQLEKLASIMHVGLVIARWKPPQGTTGWKRLAVLLGDADAPVTARFLAARFLSLAPTIEHAPSFRHALRAPHLQLRWIALRVLSRELRSAFTEEDMVFLLRDLVEHPLPAYPGNLYEEIEYYVHTVFELVVTFRGPAISEALKGLQNSFRDDGWLTFEDGIAIDRALGAVCPEEFLPRIDRKLEAPGALTRGEAVGALELMPEHLARPRLQAAMEDVATTVSNRARELWTKRFGVPAPPEVLSGIDRELLGTHVPSELFYSRLLVFRSRSKQARQAMAEVLLSEEPTHESLVLLAFALGDADAWEHPDRPTLPKNHAEWFRFLPERYGLAGLQAVQRHCMRGRINTFAWLLSFQTALEGRAWSEEVDEAARSWSTDLIHTDKPLFVELGIKIFGVLRAPEKAIPRLFSLVFSPPECFAKFRGETKSALENVQPSASLDARLESEFYAARTEASDRAAVLLSIGIARGVPSLCAFALQLLPERDPALEALQTVCFEAVKDPGARKRWAKKWITRPESALFLLAVRELGLDPRYAPHLRRALLSDARDGAAAQEAALYLCLRKVPPTSPSMLRAFAKMAPHSRVYLLPRLLAAGMKLRRVWPCIEELFYDSDREITRSLMSWVKATKAPERLDYFARVYPKVKDLLLRRVLETVLRLPHHNYWRDHELEERAVSSSGAV